ncbi:MAG: hypothetical protein KC478_16765, partial [Bacteriovoracaceae bacterium]|nr:hypothetical protein [Bacteriovoracaceae bacterium]
MRQTPTSTTSRIGHAAQLMESFAHTTGIAGNSKPRRYLWTDAYAVENFMELGRRLNDQHYTEYALDLIDDVHYKLGRFDPKDSRKGWLSGLEDGQAKRRPVAAGLRIGKPKLERGPDEKINYATEWDRDGQYFHYLMRWVQALLKTGEATRDGRYHFWAADLCSVAAKAFIQTKDGELWMPWKLSVDLKRALVPTMGAHDPLDGYLTALEILQSVPEFENELKDAILKYGQLCKNNNWSSPDPLATGSLLINTLRAQQLEKNFDLVDECKPGKLLDDSLLGIEAFLKNSNLEALPNLRLAFRECGLSLGLRHWEGRESKLDKYIPLSF